MTASNPWIDKLPSKNAAELEGVAARFEAAWRQGLTPVIDAYLPAEPLQRQAVLIELVHADLEFRLRAGELIRVEEYLERYPELREAPEAVLALVAVEYALRRHLEPNLGLEEYLQRFPQIRDQLLQSLTEPEIVARGTIPDGPPEVISTPPRDPAQGAGSTPAGPSVLDLRDYELLEQLGHGGMGEVYRSRDPGLGRDLALKVLRPEVQGNREMEHRFELEARITGLLQHPGIVPVYNLGRLPDGRLYFTMKVVRGRTFADILSDPGERTAEQRSADLGIFEKVCQTLAYAHSRNGHPSRPETGQRHGRRIRRGAGDGLGPGQAVAGRSEPPPSRRAKSRDLP